MGAIAQRLHTAVNKLFHGNKRQMMTVAAALFIVSVLLLSGIFSYFHSEDKVTNRLDARNGSVTLQEPDWDTTGQYKARASEPGMIIEKNPSGFNNGQVDLYIRLKMTIDADSYVAKNDTYAENFPDVKENRIAAILGALKLADGSDFWDGSDTTNLDFIMDYDAENDIYYFYFTHGNSAQKMEPVAPQQGTTDLFDHIEIPIYKKDYFGVFDQEYNIILEAEGIPAANYPNGLTVGEAKGANGAFEKS